MYYWWVQRLDEKKNLFFTLQKINFTIEKKKNKEDEIMNFEVYLRNHSYKVFLFSLISLE